MKYLPVAFTPSIIRYCNCSHPVSANKKSSPTATQWIWSKSVTFKGCPLMFEMQTLQDTKDLS